MAEKVPPTVQDADREPRNLVRVLVVDDYKPWRRWVCSVLHTYEQFQIVGEIGDGLEAVRQAQVLEPDLILLDIGLPGLNGIEAARQIEEHVPESKILFVTLRSDTETVAAVLRDGALGYVLKKDAGKQLVPAIAAVLRGEKFVSPRHRKRDPTPASRPTKTGQHKH